MESQFAALYSPMALLHVSDPKDHLDFTALVYLLSEDIPTMSYHQGLEDVESIDQVIQSEESLSVPNDHHPRASESNLSINRTAPLPPLSPSNRSNRNVQPKSQATNGGNRGGSPRRTDTVSSRNASVRRSEEGSAGSRSGTGTTLNGSGLGGNMADFFSSEVFNIVIHNPTTAHRFLRFCQSRACGENMEFLQKVVGLLVCDFLTSQCLHNHSKTYN
jgi:hypothetical protein